MSRRVARLAGVLMVSAAVGSVGVLAAAPAEAGSGSCRGYKVPYGQTSSGSSGAGLCYLANGNFGAQWRDRNGRYYFYDTGVHP